MKKDLQIVLQYLRECTDTLSHSEIYLKGEKEDSKMLTEIKNIAKKNGLNF